MIPSRPFIGIALAQNWHEDLRRVVNLNGGTQSDWCALALSGSRQFDGITLDRYRRMFGRKTTLTIPIGLSAKAALVKASEDHGVTLTHYARTLLMVHVAEDIERLPPSARIGLTRGVRYPSVVAAFPRLLWDAANARRAKPLYFWRLQVMARLIDIQGRLDDPKPTDTPIDGLIRDDYRAKRRRQLRSAAVASMAMTVNGRALDLADVSVTIDTGGCDVLWLAAQLRAPSPEGLVRAVAYEVLKAEGA